MVVGENVKSTYSCSTQEAEAGGLDIRGYPGLVSEKHQLFVRQAYMKTFPMPSKKSVVDKQQLI